MARFVGVKNNSQVVFVVDYDVETEKDVEIVVAPRELETMDPEDIPKLYRVWRNTLVKRNVPLPLEQLHIATVGYSQAEVASLRKLVKSVHRFNTQELCSDILKSFEPDFVLLKYNTEHFNVSSYLTTVSSLSRYKTICEFSEYSNDLRLEGLANFVLVRNDNEYKRLSRSVPKKVIKAGAGGWGFLTEPALYE